MTNTIIPIIIPVSSSKDPVCPECGKPEDVKTLCKHCNYEYPEDETNTSKIVLILLSVIVGVWIAITIFIWFLECGSSYGEVKPTLLEMFINQFKFLSGLKLW